LSFIGHHHHPWIAFKTSSLKQPFESQKILQASKMKLINVVDLNPLKTVIKHIFPNKSKFNP
jgi:hypothetical protein